MTQIQLDKPTDEQTFADALTEFLQTAEQHDVSMERAWECCTGDDGWEVEIVPLAPHDAN